VTVLPPPADLDAIVATRTALHSVAEAIAAEQFASNSELALHATATGFATGWFPGAGHEPARLEVSGAQLVRYAGATTSSTRIDGLDADAVAALVAWWSLGDDVLSDLPLGGDTISPVILWPEHFDIAVTVTTPDERGLNLGFSPGDEFSAEPYAYAGPWTPLTGLFWNAPFGAYRTYSQIAEVNVGDARRAALDFLTEARELFDKS
jgi:hypothetical protein